MKKKNRGSKGHIENRKARFLRTVGQNLLHVRTSKGLTIDEVSERVGVSKKRLQRIENGTANYNLKILYEICDLYKVNVLDVVP